MIPYRLPIPVTRRIESGKLVIEMDEKAARLVSTIYEKASARDNNQMSFDKIGVAVMVRHGVLLDRNAVRVVYEEAMRKIMAKIMAKMEELG